MQASGEAQAQGGAPTGSSHIADDAGGASSSSGRPPVSRTGAGSRQQPANRAGIALRRAAVGPAPWPLPAGPVFGLHNSRATAAVPIAVGFSLQCQRTLHLRARQLDLQNQQQEYRRHLQESIRRQAPAQVLPHRQVIQAAESARHARELDALQTAVTGISSSKDMRSTTCACMQPPCLGKHVLLFAPLLLHRFHITIAARSMQTPARSKSSRRRRLCARAWRHLYTCGRPLSRCMVPNSLPFIT